MVALDHGLDYCLVLAINKREHFSDAVSRVGETIPVEEFENTDHFHSVKDCFRGEHHYKQSASVVHLSEEFAELKVSDFDCLAVLDKLLLAFECLF